jgi:ABC-2 type transport system ATP-binding protein
VATVRERFGGERILVVDLETPSPPLQIEGATVERVEGARQWLHFRRSEISAARLVAEVAAQAPVVDLSIEETPIEEIVRRIYLGTTAI